jgi:leucyl aminopeptidase
MKSTARTVALERSKADLLAVAVGGMEDRKLPRSLETVDRTAGGAMTRAFESGDFTGERDQTALFYPSEGPHRILLVGLGEQKEMGPGAVRRAAAVAGRIAIANGVEAMAFHVAPEYVKDVTPGQIGQLAVEGTGQGAWFFDDLRTEKKNTTALKSVTVIGSHGNQNEMSKGRHVGDAIAAGQRLARDLQMLPSNVCTPNHLASEARKLARRHGMKVTVMNRARMEQAGMRALLAVAQGAAQEPRFITLEYDSGKRGAPICLVGKGVTFDTGGISLKPALNMEEMKFDMSGAAAVLGTFEVLGTLKPKVNVVGLIPATDNMPSGTAVKPGDVVKTHLGKTVEIINTDAEGRLILCDALSYARRFKPVCIVNIATLTGAVVIALGHHAVGVMGNDDALVEELRDAGELAGERCWPLPLWDEYRPQIKSDIADVKNTGGRPAGSITAGWFLREFADEHPWAHLDIAGTAYTDRDRPGLGKGPTGIGVRLFSQFILGRAAG